MEMPAEKLQSEGRKQEKVGILVVLDNIYYNRFVKGRLTQSACGTYNWGSGRLA